MCVEWRHSVSLKNAEITKRLPECSFPEFIFYRHRIFRLPLPVRAYILSQSNPDPNHRPTSLWSRRPLQELDRELDNTQKETVCLTTTPQKATLPTHGIKLQIIKRRRIQKTLLRNLDLIKPLPTGRMSIRLSIQQHSRIIREPRTDSAY